MNLSQFKGNEIIQNSLSFFNILFKYSWFIELCSFLPFSEVIQLYICIFFSYFFIMVYQRILNVVPCAIQWTLLFIHPVYTDLHLLIPNSQSFLPHPSLATTSPFSMSMSLFLFPRYVHLCQILDSIHK